MSSIRNKMRIKRLENTFIRDRWGNLTPCFWNDMVKQEIESMESLHSIEKQIKKLS